jgi:hypothetical protein
MEADQMREMMGWECNCFDGVEVKYAELDHRSLNRLHAHSCTQPIRARNEAIVFFLSSLHLYDNVWLLPVISLLLKPTLYRGYGVGLAYPHYLRGFVRTKKKTNMGLLV